MTAPIRSTVGTFDAQVLEVDMDERCIDVYMSCLVGDTWVTTIHDRHIRWRGYYGAAIERTCRCLIEMGAGLDSGGEPTGIGSQPFVVDVTKIECSLAETGGKPGVFRIFVRGVRAKGDDRATRG